LDPFEPARERTRKLRVERRLRRPRNQEPMTIVRRDVATFGHPEIHAGLCAAELIANEIERGERIMSNEIDKCRRRYGKERAPGLQDLVQAIAAESVQRL
jgi:hypothetical protein